MRSYISHETQGGGGSSRVGVIKLPNRNAVDVAYISTTLDDHLHNHTKVDVIKIDVEGAECSVLTGAQKFLEKFKPIIFLEVNIDKSFGGVRFEDVWEIVSGYDVDYDPRLLKAYDGKIEYHVFLPQKIDSMDSV